MTEANLGRRAFLGNIGAGAVVLGLGARSGPTLWRQPAIAGASGVDQVHLQFGADPTSAMTVSWVSEGSVANPRVRFGDDGSGLGGEVQAATTTYKDFATGREVTIHHATLEDLAPDKSYVYQALHDGADPVDGGFRTAPAGPAEFRFTSFGDQGTAEHLGSPQSNIVVDHVEDQAPLFHLVNGDLAYSDLHADPGHAWDNWFRQNERSAAARPWMPAAGNHEQETGNGAHGYAAFQNRFLLPDNGVDGLAGLFYAFTVGSVRFVVLQNDDVCYQWATNDYVRGYSDGAQKAWLDTTLAEARNDQAIDWVVVCMHQLVMSSSVGNGCDRGIREEFAPLFDEHGVDLVLCGHDHDYERTYKVKGVDPDSPTLRPQVVDDTLDVVDTSDGAVHLVLGGGGSIPRAEYGPHGPGSAIVNVGKGEQFRPVVEHEDAVWSAKTDTMQAFGFASFDVDPGEDGGTTSIAVTYYRTAAAAGQPASSYDQFRLEKPRRAVAPTDAAATRPRSGSDNGSDDGLPWPAIAGGAVGAAAVVAGGTLALRRRAADGADGEGATGS